MSVAVKDILRASRPPGPPGRVDKYLPDIAQDLRRLLEKSQCGFHDPFAVWPEESLSELAAELVEFGEDLHADAGLWRSLEGYHREFFGTPLPLAADTDPMPRCPFQAGLVVFGSLTPWRGEWYWSGEQRTYPNVPEHEEAHFRKEMLECHPRIAYRYCPAEAARAREANRKRHDEFVAHCGGDLVVYPDGLSLAAAEQKRLESLWRAADQEHVRRLMRERGLTQPRPTDSWPNSTNPPSNRRRRTRASTTSWTSRPSRQHLPL